LILTSQNPMRAFRGTGSSSKSIDRRGETFFILEFMFNILL
jgi:hypothetical protein